MGRVRSALASVACAALLALSVAPTARAGDLPGPTDDLSGRWASASLRLNGVGYSLTLIPAEAGSDSDYAAALRITFQDGTRGPRIKASLAVDGRKLVLRLGGGGGALSGTVGMDGSIYFAGCFKQLPYVTKATASAMCLFQEFPR